MLADLLAGRDFAPPFQNLCHDLAPIAGRNQARDHVSSFPSMMTGREENNVGLNQPHGSAFSPSSVQRPTTTMLGFIIHLCSIMDDLLVFTSHLVRIVF